MSKKLGMFFFCIGSLVAQAQVLESLQNPSAVTVTKSGTMTAASEGTALSPQDTVTVGNGASAAITYPDGSQVVLTDETQVTIQPKDGQADSIELKNGAVHADISKSDPKGPNPYKFFIKNSSAVMGVRGTELVAENGAQGAQLHTLTGTVDVAKDTASMTSPTHVPAGQAVTASGGSVGTPSKFDVGSYRRSFARAHPHAAALRNRVMNKKKVLRQEGKGEKKKRKTR